jgi:sec-independent protein translocase protein TatA
MSFFGIGVPELLLIMLVALVVLGPDRLPQAAVQLGRAVRDFRRWSADLTAEFQSVTKEFSAEFEELRAATQELQAELRGVQSDLANEMRVVNQALQGQEVAATVDGSSGYSASQTWAPASPGAVTSAPAYESSQEATMVASQPPQATKGDPRSDVSLLDLDEVVVMPRTSRPVNGHHALNGHEPAAAVPPAPRARQPRPERPAYRRPLRQRR